jgi:hypothetical protein
MRLVRNWYPLLEGTGLTAKDMGPANKPGTLSANVTWCPYYGPGGLQLGYKGVIIAASQSRIVSAAAAGFNAAEGSIEMLVKPSWSYDDGLGHYFWDTYGGANKRFYFRKTTANLTNLVTNGVSRGDLDFHWVVGNIYHIVLNWPANELYVCGSLVKDYDDGDLGDGAADLYIGDRYTTANQAFNGNIYYFIVRDVPLTQDEVNYFYEFFLNQYFYE